MKLLEEVLRTHHLVFHVRRGGLFVSLLPWSGTASLSLAALTSSSRLERLIGLIDVRTSADGFVSEAPRRFQFSLGGHLESDRRSLRYFMRQNKSFLPL